MYAGSFWSRPYKTGAPKRLLKAQEDALLVDIRSAIDKRVESRIATARRFAVRLIKRVSAVLTYKRVSPSNRFAFEITPKWSIVT